jgi:nonsense-mediated mRNA decay protein 3
MADIDVCIKCGAKQGSKAFVDLLCIDCYTPHIEIPKSFAVTLCHRCGAVLRGKKWLASSPREIGKWLAIKVKGSDARNVAIDINSSTLTFEVETERGNVPITVPIRVEIQKALCEHCNKMAGGYYEAIIQFRGRPDRASRWADKISEFLQGKTFVAGREELKEGIDLKVGSSKAALSAINDAGIKDYVISKKLWGLKQGKRVYRTTFALRFERPQSLSSWQPLQGIQGSRQRMSLSWPRFPPYSGRRRNNRNGR